MSWIKRWESALHDALKNKLGDRIKGIEPGDNHLVGNELENQTTLQHIMKNTKSRAPA